VEGPPVGIDVQGKEAHQSLVSLEAADLRRPNPGAVRREQEGSLAGEGPGEDPTLQDRVEIEHQIEASAPKLRQKTAGDPPGAHQVPSPQTLRQHSARKQEHFVDPGLSLHDVHRGGLDEPGDVRARVGGAQG
jgi:hypothetical protein